MRATTATTTTTIATTTTRTISTTTTPQSALLALSLHLDMLASCRRSSRGSSSSSGRE